MGKIIITESEKIRILKQHRLLKETISKRIKDLPQDIQSALRKLGEKINKSITDEDVSREWDQEGEFRRDNGGENPKAKSQILKLLDDLGNKFPNVDVKIKSGYRSYDKQVENFASKVNGGRSFNDVQRYNTLPGFSQHHTGKTFDIISTEQSWWDSHSNVEEWVKNNCKKYGFNITYRTNGVLRGKEPWHLYYVGGESNEPESLKKQGNTTNDKPKVESDPMTEKFKIYLTNNGKTFGSFDTNTLTGTDSEEFLYYYNRNTKKFLPVFTQL